MEALFDIRTVMMSVGLMLVAASVGMATAARMMPRFASLPLWALVFLLQGCGMLLSSLRGAIATLLAILLSNLLMGAGQVLMPFALARDLAQPCPVRRLGLATLAGALLYGYAYWIAPWTELRTVAVSILGTAAFLLCAQMVRAHLRRPASPGIAWGMLFPLLIIGLIHLVGLTLSGWHALHNPPAPEAYPGATVLTSGPARMPLLLVGALCIVALAFSVILHVALRLNLELQHQATHDALTGLSNRTGFEQAAMRLLAAHQRQQKPCALLFMDLDHFKQINDQHGHAAGDHVLGSFAALLRRELRQNDLVARFGGEEFCVFLPETTPARAGQIAQRLCDAALQLQPVWQQASIRLSISVGLALPGEHHRTLHSLLAAADHALYAAKDAGRNRVVLAA